LTCAFTARPDAARGSSLERHSPLHVPDLSGQATDAAESRASERFQVAQHARHFESNRVHPRTHSEVFTVDEETAEFQTFNEFLGSTLEVTINGQCVEATPILGNRGFRLPSGPAKGSDVRVYYEIEGVWSDDPRSPAV
jgi:hypothetical protein